MTLNPKPPSRTPVLFCRPNSIYQQLDLADPYDRHRNALTYAGPWPVIAHPPCRLWGRLKGLADHSRDDKDLARFAVQIIRKFGGILEHPAHSALWPDQQLPRPGERPQDGLWTLDIAQHWFGHKAEKQTWLLINGLLPGDLPPIPFTLSYPTHSIGGNKHRPNLPPTTKSEREHTPLALATWLLETVRQII